MSFFRTNEQPDPGDITRNPTYVALPEEDRKEVDAAYRSAFLGNQRLGLAIAHQIAYQSAKTLCDLKESKGAFKRLQHKLEGEGKSEESAGAIAAAVGRKKYGAKAMAKGARTHTPVSEDEISECQCGTPGCKGCKMDEAESVRKSKKTRLPPWRRRASDAIKKMKAAFKADRLKEKLKENEWEGATDDYEPGVTYGSESVDYERLRAFGITESELEKIIATESEWAGATDDYEPGVTYEAEDDPEQDAGSMKVQDKNRQEYCGKCGSVHANKDSCLGNSKENPEEKGPDGKKPVGSFDKGIDPNEEPIDAQKNYDTQTIKQAANILSVGNAKNNDAKATKANEWENAENFFGESETSVKENEWEGATDDYEPGVTYGSEEVDWKDQAIDELNEAATSRRVRRSGPEAASLKIARQTLKMHPAFTSGPGRPVVGGPNRDEARETIKRLTGKEVKESEDMSADDWDEEMRKVQAKTGKDMSKHMFNQNKATYGDKPWRGKGASAKKGNLVPKRVGLFDPESFPVKEDEVAEGAPHSPYSPPWRKKFPMKKTVPGATTSDIRPNLNATNEAEYADPDQVSPGSHLDDFGKESSGVKPVKKPKKRNWKDQVYKDLGMTKVRGALGGTYYESEEVNESESGMQNSHDLLTRVGYKPVNRNAGEGDSWYRTEKPISGGNYIRKQYYKQGKEGKHHWITLHKGGWQNVAGGAGSHSELLDHLKKIHGGKVPMVNEETKNVSCVKCKAKFDYTPKSDKEMQQVCPSCLKGLKKEETDPIIAAAAQYISYRSECAGNGQVITENTE